MDTDSGLLWSNGLSGRLLHEPSRKRRRQREGGSRERGPRGSRRRCDVRGCPPHAGCTACTRRSGLRIVVLAPCLGAKMEREVL